MLICFDKIQRKNFCDHNFLYDFFANNWSLISRARADFDLELIWSARLESFRICTDFASFWRRELRDHCLQASRTSGVTSVAIFICEFCWLQKLRVHLPCGPPCWPTRTCFFNSCGSISFRPARIYIRTRADILSDPHRCVLLTRTWYYFFQTCVDILPDPRELVLTHACVLSFATRELVVDPCSFVWTWAFYLNLDFNLNNRCLIKRRLHLWRNYPTFRTTTQL